MVNNWLDKSEYPFSSNYFIINSRKLHYIDEGSGPVLLFVHGTPSWSFEFRNIIKTLKQSYRCVAIDHIGFGLSDKPEHYDYSTINHSKTLEDFVSAKNLKDITLIVHDFGGPIGFNFAISHPDAVKSIVVINSWMWSSKDDPDFKKLSKLLKSPLLRFLYRYFNFSPRFILPRSFSSKPLSCKLLKQYTKPFRHKSQRNGVMAFLSSLLNDQDWFEELWKKKQAIANKPVLLIWGMKDPAIKPAYLDKFIVAFVNPEVYRLEQSGHFPQEEEPENVTRAISAFLDKNT